MADDINTVIANAQKMRMNGAGDDVLTRYIAAHGFSVDELQSHLENRKKAGTGTLAFIDNLVRQVANGLTFNLADEASAGMNALTGGRLSGDPAMTGDYSANLDAERGRDAAFSSLNPKTALAANVGGAMIPALATAGAAGAFSAPTMGAAMGRGVLAGGATGGAAGFGAAEGGLANRAEGATWGAGIGAVTGAVLPPIGAAIGAAGGPVVRRLVRATPAAYARSKVLQAIQRDQMTPGELAHRYRGAIAETPGKPITLMDVGGENLVRAARAAETVPGPGFAKLSNFLRERQEGQRGRILGDVNAVIAQSGVGFHRSLQDLAVSRAEMAAPIYQEAFRAAGEVWSPKLATLISRPSMRGAWARAKTLAAEQDRTLPNVFKENATEGLETTGRQMPTLEAWDYMKQALDDIIDSARDPASGRIVWTKQLRAVDETRKTLLAELDQVVEAKVGAPIYATARRTWAGPSQAMDAMNMGRDLFSRDAEITAEVVKKLSPGDRQAFRLGVAQAIKDIVDATPDGVNAARRLFGSPDKRAAIAASFDSLADFNRFSRLMTRELMMFRRGAAVTGNSQTGRILADQADTADQNLGFLGNVLSGDWKGAALSLAGPRILKLQGLSPEASDEIARMLFTATPAENEAILRALAQAQSAAAGSLGGKSARALGASAKRAGFYSIGTAAGQAANQR